MMPAGVQPTEYTPIFDWGPPRRRISFVTFLAASIVLHALCFYIFQIVYPLTVALLPPPARINLITADSEQGRLLLRWVEAEDPALSSTTQRPAETVAALPFDPRHVPSYVLHQPALKQLARYQPDLRIPSAEPPAPVALPGPSAPSPMGVMATSLRFADKADALSAPKIPPFHFTASRQEPPSAAQFRVGLQASGVHYCFLENSSGDPALDEQARRVLLLCRFPDFRAPALPAEKILWTTAAFQWGNDIALPASATAESPAP